MQTHFAYPNVLPREQRFVGCGRYRVMNPKDGHPENYYSVEETPNTPNRMVLEHAMQTLGPESYAAAKTIYERRDLPSQKYQGDSLDLAYLLAHIHRGRNLKNKLSGDIWCTGVVQTSDGKPILRKVDPTGFELKLDAFLASENEDDIFIVPAANINTKIKDHASFKGVACYTLGQFANLNAKNQTTQSDKLIIKVLPNELPNLMESLFLSKSIKNHKKKWLLSLSIIILIVSLFWIFIVTPKTAISEDEIRSLIFNGEFDEAKNKLAQADGNQLWAVQISAALNEKLDADVHLIFRRNDNSLVHQTDSESTGDLILTHRDYYRIKINLSKTEYPLYLYLFQFDTMGNLDRLFPSRLWETSNPVNQTTTALFVPSDPKDWLYLSELDRGTKGLIREQVILILSPWPAVDLETLYEKFQLAADNGHRRLILESFLERLNVREKATALSMAVKRIIFWHGK
ncbi:hypothetical protein [Desulfosarcina ovata]|nr:hypothetical protein [Desulfosarcina ovata]